MPLAFLFGASALAYLLFLFVVAYRVERSERRLAALARHPAVFALSLAVFYTGWSYFSAGSSLIASGLFFLAIQIGASFTFLFAWPILACAVRIAQHHRVTTLPGLLAVRFGHSPWLTGLVALLLLLGTLPYIALQIGALGFALENAIAEPSVLVLRASKGIVLVLTAVLAIFAIAFGVRRADPTRRNSGMVVSLAIDGVVKLLAMAVLTAFVCLSRPHWFTMLNEPAVWPHLLMGSTPTNTYANWLAYLLISAGAVALLPHVFHLLVVESAGPRQVEDVRAALPAYGWLMYLLIIPIAFAGVAIGLTGAGNQAAILLLPQAAHQPLLVLIAYLGSVAASAGMTIAALVALTNLITADLVLPLIARMTTRLGPWLLPLRWLMVLAVAWLAFEVWAHSDATFLSQFGLVSFIAAAQLAPAFFLGMTWAGLPRRAALLGIVLGGGTWVYTAFLPAFASSTPSLARWVAEGAFGYAWLRPHALFGLQGLDPYAHAFFWSMAANLAGLILYALAKPAASAEVAKVKALLCGRSESLPVYDFYARPFTEREIEAVLVKYLGERQTREQMPRIQSEIAAPDLPPAIMMQRSREALLRALSAPLGALVAGDIVNREFPVIRTTNDLAQERDRLLQTNERLAKALEDLRKLDQLRGTFVNAISHDLRIPLTGITGYAEFLEDEIGGPLSEQQREYARQIQQTAARMTRLLNDLLDFARYEAGKIQVMPRPIALAQLLEGAIATFRAAAEKKGLQLVLELAPDLPMVQADPDRTLQVVSNLLSNAIKFTSVGGAIRLQAYTAPGVVVTEIADTGLGIPPEALPHLFERFFQTETGIKAGGSGLGLPISKELVEAQGGTMDVRSELGVGTTFRFTLPKAVLP